MGCFRSVRRQRGSRALTRHPLFLFVPKPLFQNLFEFPVRYLRYFLLYILFTGFAQFLQRIVLRVDAVLVGIPRQQVVRFANEQQAKLFNVREFDRRYIAACQVFRHALRKTVSAQKRVGRFYPSELHYIPYVQSEHNRSGFIGCENANITLLPEKQSGKVNFIFKKVDFIFKKVSNVFKKVGSIFIKVGGVFIKVGSIFIKVGGIFIKVSNVFKKVGGVFIKVGSVFKKVGGVFIKVGGIFKKVGGVFKKVSNIFKKVSNVFKKVGNVFKKVGSVFKKVSNVFKKVSIVFKKVGFTFKNIHVGAYCIRPYSVFASQNPEGLEWRDGAPAVRSARPERKTV